MKPEENYLSLTTIDAIILDSYKCFIPQLGHYLGDGYEIILHSLADLQHSVVAIVHGEYSGRKVGSPITNLALEMLARIQKTNTLSPIYYTNHTAKGAPLQSCTIPILGESKRIIGLLCLNFHTDVPLSVVLARFLPTASPAEAHLPVMVESFTDNVDELIGQTVGDIRKQVLDDPAVSQQNKNKEIVSRLNEKGIFNLKDAVVKVAALLQISKNTIYLHLRSLRDGG